MNSPIEYFDVIIIGAGLSGIGAARHLQMNCPNKSFIILEARARIGGTWDLFQYPGIRSDSDMYTLGYSFKPWEESKAIADGPAILKYIKETAEEGGVNEYIHFNNKVIESAWDSTTSKWTITGSEGQQYECNFLINCTGYYNYDKGHMPDYKGLEDFKGTMIHPQHWDTNLDYSGKKMIVIGSGATAVTLVPELAKKAASVTMLQRSPSYVVTVPAEDKLGVNMRKVLPAKVSYFISRWINISLAMSIYNFCIKWPQRAKKMIMKGVRRSVGDSVDVNTHFNPSYDPWKQRVCLVPDDDLFKVLKKGKADIVTDHIDHFTEKGIQLKSGKELEADIVVSATGLKILFLGGMTLKVDGEVVNPADLVVYRGMMFNNIPNFVVVVGYTNASWTLKSDLTSEYICRLLNEMDKSKKTKCYPQLKDSSMELEPILDFQAGYVLRALDSIPKQGTKRPWKLFQNYFFDLFNFRYSSLKDDVMTFE